MGVIHPTPYFLSPAPSRPPAHRLRPSSPLPNSRRRPIASQKQIDANRRNAQLSTGPKTPERKAAVKHGLSFFRTIVLREENRQEFEELLDAFRSECQPQGPPEQSLVFQLAATGWRLRRISRIEAGHRLASLQLDYEQPNSYPLESVVTPACSLSYRVEDKMRLSKDKRSLVVNPSLTLAGIPPEVFEYRLGNRSALEWVIDQYQVTEDPPSRIPLDPNRPNDPEYIVRLLGQVIRVSLETLQILRTLPAWH